MQDISQKLADFLANNSISQAALARSIGISPATISQVLKGEYKGDLKGVAQKINNYIGNYTQKPKNETKEGIKTHTKDMKMVEFIIKEAVREREIGLIYGPAGTGKTTALKHYASTHSNAILIEANPHTTAKALLRRLCVELKLEFSPDLELSLNAIASFLSNSDRVILIDEGEHLPLKALEDLRRIADFSKTAVILAGTNVLLSNILGANKSLKQLHSRVCGKHQMLGLDKAECDEIFGEYIYEYSGGNFRNSAKLANRAKRLAELNGVPLDENVVKEALSMIIL